MNAGIESFFTDWEVTLVILADLATIAFIAWALLKYVIEAVVRIWEKGPQHGHFAASYGCPVCDMWVERLLHRGPLPITKAREAELRKLRQEARTELAKHYEEIHGRGHEIS